MATQTSVLGLSKPAGNENALVSVLNSDMDLIDAEAGKVRGNIAATYSASGSYAVGDLCINNGILYKCNTPIGSGGETWNASHWTQITIDGELTALNGKFTINHIEIEGTTDANGNVVASGYATYLHKIINVLPIRTSPYYTSAYNCSITTTSGLDYLIIHASNNDGTPLVSQSIKVRANYLNFSVT